MDFYVIFVLIIFINFLLFTYNIHNLNLYSLPFYILFKIEDCYIFIKYFLKDK